MTYIRRPRCCKFLLWLRADSEFSCEKAFICRQRLGRCAAASRHLLQFFNKTNTTVPEPMVCTKHFSDTVRPNQACTFCWHSTAAAPANRLSAMHLSSRIMFQVSFCSNDQDLQLPALAHPCTWVCHREQHERLRLQNIPLQSWHLKASKRFASQ